MRTFCELFFGNFAFLQQLLQKRSPLFFEGGSSGKTAIAADAHDVSNVAGDQILGKAQDNKRWHDMCGNNPNADDRSDNKRNSM